MSKHTPGPWVVVVDPTEEGAVVEAHSADGKTVVTEICHAFIDHDDDSTRANLKLIAAAPSMAKALKDIGCRSARVYASGNSCSEREAAGETVKPCFVCAALQKAGVE